MTENQLQAEKKLIVIKNKMGDFRNISLEIEALEYAASGMGAIRYDKEHVDGGSVEDKKIVFISDALNKRAELEELEAELDELKANCYNLIKQIQDPSERIVLEWYYINDRPMRETMKKIHVSERKAYYIRNDALEHFGELLK